MVSFTMPRMSFIIMVMPMTKLFHFVGASVLILVVAFFRFFALATALLREAGCTLNLGKSFNLSYQFVQYISVYIVVHEIQEHHSHR